MHFLQYTIKVFYFQLFYITFTGAVMAVIVWYNNVVGFTTTYAVSVYHH